MRAQGHRDQGEVVNRVAAQDLQFPVNRRGGELRAIHPHADRRVSLKLRRGLESTGNQANRRRRRLTAVFHALVATPGVVVDFASLQTFEEASVELQAGPYVPAGPMGLHSPAR